MARGPDGSQDPGRWAIQRGACHGTEGKPGLGSPMCSHFTSPLLEGHLGFSGGHLRPSHPPWGLAIPREA